MDIVGEKNLRDMWDELVENYGDKTALIFEDYAENTCELSYSALNNEINKAANLFLELGVKKGDRVALQLYNSPEFIKCWFGLAKIGAVAVPVNTQYLYEESEYLTQVSGASMAVVEEDFFATFEKIHLSGLTSIHRVLVARSQADSIPENVNFNAMLQKHSCNLTQIIHLSSDDPAEILFTSGTTSKPKGAVLTHANLIFAGNFVAWQGGFKSDDRYLTMMPNFHIDFQCNAAMPTFTVGATFIVLEKYSARKYWSQVCLHRATVTQFMPFVVRTLMLQPRQVWERNHCVREVMFGLCLSDQEKNDFEERFQVRLLNSFGMTETLVGLITDCPGEKRHWPSVGRPGLGYEAKIIDDHGQELDVGEIGEIYVKGVPGRSIFKEYYNNPKATAETIKDGGWMHTGDKGYRDASGLFYFVDRKVNMIKRSGENISSSEIENILTAHPQIAEAAVIGVPDDLRDEAVKAFVLLKDGAILTEKEIIAYCAQKLAKFKVPSFVEIATTFPRTCTGKIQKKYLN